MKQQTPAFNSTLCAFHQLFKVFEQLHPNEAAAFSPQSFILFIELTTNAIASELAEKERTVEGGRYLSPREQCQEKIGQIVRYTLPVLVLIKTTNMYLDYCNYKNGYIHLLALVVSNRTN